MTEAQVGVVIVEDQEIFRRGLCAQFDTDPRIKVLAEFATAYEAVLGIPELRPSVVLMDLRLPWRPREKPRYCGADAIKEIRRLCPEARIAVITAFADQERVREALRAGAHGYVLKEGSAEELIQAVHQTAAGVGTLSPGIVELLPGLIGSPSNGSPEFPALTRRENEILMLYAKAKSIDDIARILSISRKTVENRLSDIPGKLGVSTRQEAAELARETWLSKHVDDPGQPG